MIAALLDHLWQSTIFALPIAAFAYFLKNNSAKSRYALWLAASIKFLIPFSLLVALGTLLPAPVQAPLYAPESLEMFEQTARPFASAVTQISPVAETGINWMLLLSGITNCQCFTCNHFIISIYLDWHTF